MFLNIITPCVRTENLHTISKSINIPKENYRWIIVFDSESAPDKSLIPEYCEFYVHKNSHSRSGNAQRNFALNLIEKGHIYFNDDDTVIHENLWENIKDLNNDFISFEQNHKNGKLRLDGKNIKLNAIDSHNFIISFKILQNTRFLINEYGADGKFAEQCFKKTNDWKVIEKVLSVYNSLR